MAVIRSASASKRYTFAAENSGAATIADPGAGWISSEYQIVCGSSLGESMRRLRHTQPTDAAGGIVGTSGVHAPSTNDHGSGSRSATLATASVIDTEALSGRLWAVVWISLVPPAIAPYSRRKTVDPGSARYTTICAGGRSRSTSKRFESVLHLTLIVAV